MMVQMYGAELEMISLNTVAGDAAVGERGLLALPGRESEARVAINQAIEYATKINCRNIHAMAGNASGSRAEECYLDNPGYFLFTSKHAVQILDCLNRNNVKLMFDCYHIARMEGGVEDKPEALLP